MLACEDYPSLKDRQLQKISREFPPWMGTSHADHKDYGRCFILASEYGGGIICHRNLDDPSKYASAEFAAILVDELTKNPYDTFSFLRTRLRWPGLHTMESPFIAGTNPGSIGHSWVKGLWMDSAFSDEWIHPVDYRGSFGYVPSKAEDNPYLDSSYWETLNTLPEGMRQAFRDGRWDLFIGQAFQNFNEVYHVIDPIWPIPDHAPVYMTFDWGFGKPFSVGWWWCDADSRIYRFAEWYGWNGTPNDGLRLTDSDIAHGILSREQTFGLKDRHIVRLAGPDCFSRKPNYMGGGQGPSTAENFSALKVYLTKADPSRSGKIRQFRERLKRPDDVSAPMMVVYRDCRQFIRTIPSLVVDKNDVEDVDTKGEDHVYDEACHICMARPMALRIPDKQKSLAATRIDMIERRMDGSYEEFALREKITEEHYWDRIFERMEQGGSYSDIDSR
jgi:hypothetical protein